PGVLRGGVVEGVSRQGLRPGRVLRLPARHGRSRRRGEARALHARSGRDVDDRRAVRRRRRRAEPQPGGARLLLGLDHDLHARVARAGGGSRARGPGGRGEAAGGRDRGRLHAPPPRDRDPFQPGARGATVAQTWDPERYARTARFVSELGAPVVELLAPVAGERILDLGCGDGALTEALVARGCTVVGIDASPAQVEAARRRGLDARVLDGQHLAFDREFDAVFSNAALHWMTEPDRVIAGVWRATFAQPFLAAAPDRTALLDAVRAELRPHLCGADGRWTADYVRLRFAAAKPG